MLNHPQELPHAETRLKKLRAAKSNAPLMLRDHQLLQRRLYFNQNRLFDLFYIASRLSEETCEVSDAARSGDRASVEYEMADVGSFMFALVNRMNKDRPESEWLYIDNLVWRRYPYACKGCHRNVCCGACGHRPT